MSTPLPIRPLKWYQGLDRYCWIVLTIAALGWLFDTLDQNLFNLVRAPSMRELLAPLHPGWQIAGSAAAKALTHDIRATGGLVATVFLLGWAVGGFIFGILGDRLGRTRTMIVTILIYAVFTGACGLVHSWQWYAVMRFFTALGVGGEWAAGAALVAETFPQRSRPMALGFLQALSAVGNMTACLVTLGLGDLNANWRIAFFIGAAPALLVIWITKSVHEPEAWKQAKQHASMNKEMGNISELFLNPVLLRNTIAATLLATAGVVGLWGVANFSTDMIREAAPKGGAGMTVDGLMSAMFLVQQIGAFIGMYAFAVMAERFTRRSTFVVWFALAWVSVLLFFWGISTAGADAPLRALVLAPLLGFATLGPFSGFTVYFPELFPTRIRTTGCGFCYNAARVLAAAAPWALGSLARHVGFPMAATIVASVYLLGFLGAWIGPETKGKGLPEDRIAAESLAAK